MNRIVDIRADSAVHVLGRVHHAQTATRRPPFGDQRRCFRFTLDSAVHQPGSAVGGQSGALGVEVRVGGPDGNCLVGREWTTELHSLGGVFGRHPQRFLAHAGRQGRQSDPRTS